MKWLRWLRENGWLVAYFAAAVAVAVATWWILDKWLKQP